MGDPDRADESLVPETSWLSSSERRTVQGSLHIRANYVAMHENLLDQTHFAFLRPMTVGTAAYARSKLDVETNGDIVTIHRADAGANSYTVRVGRFCRSFRPAIFYIYLPRVPLRSTLG